MWDNLTHMYPRVLSYEATRLAAAKPTAFSQAQVPPPRTVMQLAKYSFTKTTTINWYYKHLRIRQQLVQGRGLSSPTQSEVYVITLGMHNKGGKLGVKLLLT